MLLVSGDSPSLDTQWDSGWESRLPPRITPELRSWSVASALPRFANTSTLPVEIRGNRHGRYASFAPLSPKAFPSCV